jgi:hypothetical protein
MIKFTYIRPNTTDSSDAYFHGPTSLKYSKSSKEPTKITVKPDFTIPYSMYAKESETFDWGITCESSATDLCNPGTGTSEKQSYNGVTYSYSGIKTVAPVTPDFNFGDGKPVYDVQWMSAVDDGKTWPLNQTGLIGLSKNSNFVKYLLEQYDALNDQGEFIYSYFVKVMPSQLDDKFIGNESGTFDESYLTLNGYNEAAIYKNTEPFWLKSSDPELWTFDSIKITLETHNSSKKFESSPLFDTMDIAEGETCLDLEAQPLLMLPKASQAKMDKMIEFVMNQICGQKTCKSGSDISKGPNMIMTFKDSSGTDQKITLKPNQYIFDNAQNQTQISMGYLDDSGSRCGSTAKLGLGRVFFLEKYVLFKNKGGKNFEVGIGDKIDIDDLSQIWLVYTISLSILGFMVALFILKTICLWNRKLDQDEDGEEEGVMNGEYKEV